MDLRRRSFLVVAAAAVILGVMFKPSAAETLEKVRERYPMLFFDFIGIKRLPAYPDLQKEPRGFQTEESELQESVQHPDYAEPDKVPREGNNDDGGDQDTEYGKRKSVKKMQQDERQNSRRGKAGDRQFRKAEASSGFKDFDDSSYQEEKNPPANDYYDEEVKSDEEQSLLLTLGGYQRPTEKKPYGDKEKAVREQRLEKDANEQTDNIKNEAPSNAAAENNDREPTLYRGTQPRIHGNSPTMVYGPMMSSPIATPESNYNTGLVKYPGFGFTDYFSSTPAFDYRSPLAERFHQNELNRHNVPLSRAFVSPPVQSNGIEAENPFNPTVPSMHPNIGQQPSSFQNLHFNPYSTAPSQELGAIRATNYPQNSMFGVPPFYDRIVHPGANSANQGPYFNGWNSDNRLILSQQPNFVPTSNYQTGIPNLAVGASASYRNGENEQKLASSSEGQEQPESKRNSIQNTNNQYLNYPTQNAGYGTVESLPVLNGAGQNKPMDAPLPVLPELRPTGVHFRQYFPNSPPHFPVNNRGSFLQANQGNESDANPFDTLEYFKNLRVNYPFPPTPGNNGEEMFSPYPDRSLGGPPPIVPFHSLQFASSSDGVPAEGGRVGTVASDIYEFFSARGTAAKPTTDDSVVPSCASKSNDSICFEDPDYPTRHVFYAVDSDALQLQRFLSPSSFQGSIGLNKVDDDNAQAPEDSEICQAEVKAGYPLRAQDVDGRWKVIVNVEGTPRVEGFAQRVRLEACRLPTHPCSHTEASVETRCVQKYSVNRLLTWDAGNGLHMSLFKLPIACVCQITKMETSPPPSS